MKVWLIISTRSFWVKAKHMDLIPRDTVVRADTHALFEWMSISNHATDQTGIYVDEKYQRRGVGALLVRYGNGLADSIKAGTYVGVVDASIGLFKGQGFSEQGHIDSRLEEYGGPEKVVRSTVCFRPAAGSE